ncbi:MAG: hypothetical protein AB1584_18150 [Pseudomonadota bacterium]
MGIILVPMFLVMLLVFSYLGIKTGTQAVLRAQGRLTATLILMAMSTALIAAAIVLPFTVVASTRVPAGGFILLATFGVAGVAGVAGTSFKEQYRKTGKPIHGLFAAAIFLAAASFPVTWLCLAERMQAWFMVGWSY